MNRVDELIQTLAEAHFSARQIRSVLLHEDIPPNKWGLLCKFIIGEARSYFKSPKDIAHVAIVFVHEGFPADADRGGILYWAAVEFVQWIMRSTPDISPTTVSEMLRDYGFDYTTSLDVLKKYYRSPTPCRAIQIDDARMVVMDFGERGIEIVQWKA